MDVDTYTTIALIAAMAALSISLILILIRLVAGPTLPDRVVALDLMAFTVIAFIVVYAIFSGHPAILNVALALGLIAFLGTIVFARFIERLSSAQSGGEER